MSSKGQIVIPKEMRSNIREGETFVIIKNNKQIILKKAKDFIKGKLALNLESSDEVAGWYLKQETLERKLESPQQYWKKISAISTEDIKRVAQNIFKDKCLNLAVIGHRINKNDIKELLKL